MGGIVLLYGDGRYVRDWTHVQDNATAQLLVQMQGEAGDVCNVGAGNELTNRALTEAILDQCGAGHDRVVLVADRLGHDQRCSIDTTAIRHLGWEPTISFEDGLAQSVAWYQDNKAWALPLKQAKASDRRGFVT